MKHLTLLTLLVLTAPFGWSEKKDGVEWPIELTCFTPAEVFHLYLSGDYQTSWVMPLVFIDEADSTFRNDQQGKQVFKIRAVNVASNYISVAMQSSRINPRARGNNRWIISRYNLEMYNALYFPPNKSHHGKCELGFRDLESFKRVF